MTRDELQRLSHRQLADYDAGSPGTMFADQDSGLTIDEAYRLQVETARLRSMRGETIAGYRIGCVSQAVQRQLGIAPPIFGVSATILSCPLRQDFLGYHALHVRQPEIPPAI